MRKMTVLGATALLIAGLVGSPAAAFAAPIAGAPVSATGDLESTCPKDGKVDTEGEPTSVTVTAPDGMLIVGYCVKAGSIEQGEGPETFEVDPPATEVTFSHSSGKAISHYTVFYEPSPSPSPTPSPSVPSGSPSPEPSSSEPAVEPSEGTEPTVPGEELDGEGTTEDEPEVLASTGASTAIGFTLIALALVGGGVTLIVLRRKGVLGS